MNSSLPNASRPSVAVQGEGGGTAPEAWIIWVSGYGQFDFVGTEADAEEMRRHKASWERGNGQKWRADLSTEADRLTAEIAALWASGEGVPMTVLRQRAKARDAERGLSNAAVLDGMGPGWHRSRDLSQRLGFSRAGVLKALRSLKSEGLVQVGGPDWRRVPIEATKARASQPAAEMGETGQ